MVAFFNTHVEIATEERSAELVSKLKMQLEEYE